MSAFLRPPLRSVLSPAVTSELTHAIIYQQHKRMIAGGRGTPRSGTSAPFLAFAAEAVWSSPDSRERWDWLHGEVLVPEHHEWFTKHALREPSCILPPQTVRSAPLAIWTPGRGPNGVIHFFQRVVIGLRGSGHVLLHGVPLSWRST